MKRFEGLQGGIRGLCKLAEEGFWVITGYTATQRRTEDFNNVLLAAWPR